MSSTQTLPVVIDPDTQELCLQLPEDLMERLGWSEGDELKWKETDRGWMLSKLNMCDIEIEFEEDELFKYMKAAHEMDITFNEFIARALQDIINQHEK